MTKFTVLLLDTEMSDHEIEIHHVMADTPAHAVVVAINIVVADMMCDGSDEVDALGAEESALETMKPMAVFKGHVGDIMPSTTLTWLERRRERVRAQYDRLVDAEVERRAAAAKAAIADAAKNQKAWAKARAVMAEAKKPSKIIVTAKKPTRRRVATTVVDTDGVTWDVNKTA